MNCGLGLAATTADFIPQLRKQILLYYTALDTPSYLSDDAVHVTVSFVSLWADMYHK